MQCSMPKKGMLPLFSRPLPYGVLVNHRWWAKGSRSAQRGERLMILRLYTIRDGITPMQRAVPHPHEERH